MKGYLDLKRHVLAHRQPDGRYIYRGATYDKRETLKAHGCVWLADRKAWVGPKEAGVAAGAHVLVWAFLDPYCHVPQGWQWVTEEEAIAGQTDRTNFCGLCDSRYNSPIKIREWSYEWKPR